MKVELPTKGESMSFKEVRKNAVQASNTVHQVKGVPNPDAKVVLEEEEQDETEKE